MLETAAAAQQHSADRFAAAASLADRTGGCVGERQILRYGRHRRSCKRLNATPATAGGSPLTANRPARRGSSPNIDPTRLLGRVARAFAAAQERDGEIQLRLSPPELGSLRLDVHMQDGGMVAHLQTETDAARTAILDNLPALRERLAEQGVRIERFDVDLMQRQPGGTPDQPGEQPCEAAAGAATGQPRRARPRRAESLTAAPRRTAGEGQFCRPG